MSDFGGALKPLNEYPDYKMAILGVPFDEKSSYLRGTAGGPRAIRQASTGKCYNEYTELGVNLAEETVLVDLGDVDTSGDVDKSFALTEKAVAGILDKGAAPVVLGGDHSITYPVIKAFARKHQAARHPPFRRPPGPLRGPLRGPPIARLPVRQDHGGRPRPKPGPGGDPGGDA